MRFLSDENLPRSILKFLRKKNFDVKDLQEEGLRGISDDEVCKLARKGKRIVLTYDKDFLVSKPGEIVCSTIIFHFPKIPPKEVIPYLEPLIEGIFSRKIKRPFVILLSQSKIEIVR